MVYPYHDQGRENCLQDASDDLEAVAVVLTQDAGSHEREHRHHGVQ